MNRLVLVGMIATAQLLEATMASPLSAETASFETDAVGGPPRGWLRNPLLDVSSMKLEDRYDEPDSARISLTSVIVCVGILVVAIVNQYLSQG